MSGLYEKKTSKFNAGQLKTASAPQISRKVVSSPQSSPSSSSAVVGVSFDRGMLSPTFGTPPGSASSLDATPSGVTNQARTDTHFIKPLVDQNVSEGQAVTLECSVHPFTYPDTISWYCNDVEIRPSTDYKISFRQGVCSLTLAEVFPEDSGKYVCVAMVKGNQLATTMMLRVEGPSSAAQPERGHPIFDRTLSDLNLVSGSTAYFECHVTASPPPEIVWSRRGQPLLDKARYKSTYDQRKGHTSLTILNVTVEDEGEYSCEAINKTGHASVSAILRVSDIPHVQKSEMVTFELSTRSLNKLETSISTVRKHPPPTFTIPLSDKIINEGKSARLEVSYTSVPSTVIHWFHDGVEILPSKDYQIVNLNGISSLSIREVSSKDAGKYTVQAISDSGGAECSCRITVKAVLIDEGKLIEPSKRTKLTSIKPPGKGSESVCPQFIKVLEDATVVDGDAVTLSCQVAGRPTPSISWFHNENNVDSSKDFVVNYDPQTGNTSLGITDCLPEDEGLFRCAAKNLAGYCETDCMLTVLTSEQTPYDGQIQNKNSSSVYIVKKQSKLIQKHQKFSEQTTNASLVSGHQKSTLAKKASDRPPRFTQPVQPCVSHEGKTFVLEAIAAGLPEPEIVWLKDREQLTVTGGRQAAMFDRITGMCSLIVRNALFSDSGVYSCKATNGAGRAISTANVVIVPADVEVTITEQTKSVKKETVKTIGKQETHVFETSPTFSRSLFPVTLAHLGKPILLSVEVEAQPSPKIVWLVNGKELQQGPSITMTYIKNIASLRIDYCDSTHSGEYVCKAFNKLGETTAFTTVHIQDDVNNLTTASSTLTNQATINSESITTYRVESVVNSNYISTTDASKLLKSQPVTSNGTVSSEPPRFTLPLFNQSGKDGLPMTFTVNYVGTPVPEIAWFYNGQQMNTNGDFQIITGTVSGKRSERGGGEELRESKFIIKELFPDDEGEYMCRAENILGTAVTHCHLNVLFDEQDLITTTVTKAEVVPPKKIPRRFSETIAIDHNTLLEELSLQFKMAEPKREKSEVIVRSDSLPRGQKMEVDVEPTALETKMRESKTVALKQRAEAITTQRQEMMIPIRHQRSQSETTLSVSPGRQLAEPIEPQLKVSTSQIKLQLSSTPVHEGERRKRIDVQNTARQLLRHADPNESKIAEMLRDDESSNVKGSPPVFTGLFQSLRVMDGEQVKFACVVRGNPTPEITWYHNNKAIADNPDFVTKYNKETGEVELFIVEVFPQDNGVYNCVASNKYGKAVNTAQLRVEEYEYVPDNEEAGGTSQAESSMSTDEAEFQAKTKRFLDNMEKMRQEDTTTASGSFKSAIEISSKQTSGKVVIKEDSTRTSTSSTTSLPFKENIYEETVLMADVKWHKPQPPLLPASQDVSEGIKLEATPTAMRASVGDVVSTAATEMTSVRRVATVVQETVAPQFIQLTPIETVKTIQLQPIVRTEVDIVKMIHVTSVPVTQQMQPTPVAVMTIEPVIAEVTLTTLPQTEATIILVEPVADDKTTGLKTAIEVPIDSDTVTGQTETISETAVESASGLSVVDELQPALAKRASVSYTQGQEGNLALEIAIALDIAGPHVLNDEKLNVPGTDTIPATEVQTQTVMATSVETKITHKQETTLVVESIESNTTSIEIQIQSSPPQQRTPHSSDSEEDTFYDAVERSPMVPMQLSVSDTSDIFETSEITEEAESTIGAPSPSIEPEMSETDMSELVEQNRDPKRLTDVTEADWGWYEKQLISTQTQKTTQITECMSSHTTTTTLSPETHSPTVEDDTLSVLKLLRAAPEFDLPLSDLTTTDGARTTFACHVLGYPPPVITWYLDGEALKESADFVIRCDEYGVCSLVILDTLLDDDGEYMAKAENELGSCQTVSYLTVMPRDRAVVGDAATLQPGTPQGVQVDTVVSHTNTQTVTHTHRQTDSSTSTTFSLSQQVEGGDVHSTKQAESPSIKRRVGEKVEFRAPETVNNTSEETQPAYVSPTLFDEVSESSSVSVSQTVVNATVDFLIDTSVPALEAICQPIEEISSADSISTMVAPSNSQGETLNNMKSVTTADENLHTPELEEKMQQKTIQSHEIVQLQVEEMVFQQAEEIFYQEQSEQSENISIESGFGKKLPPIESTPLQVEGIDLQQAEEIYAQDHSKDEELAWENTLPENVDLTMDVSRTAALYLAELEHTEDGTEEAEEQYVSLEEEHAGICDHMSEKLVSEVARDVPKILAAEQQTEQILEDGYQELLEPVTEQCTELTVSENPDLVRNIEKHRTFCRTELEPVVMPEAEKLENDISETPALESLSCSNVEEYTEQATNVMKIIVVFNANKEPVPNFLQEITEEKANDTSPEELVNGENVDVILEEATNIVKRISLFLTIVELVKELRNEEVDERADAHETESASESQLPENPDLTTGGFNNLTALYHVALNHEDNKEEQNEELNAAYDEDHASEGLIEEHQIKATDVVKNTSMYFCKEETTDALREEHIEVVSSLQDAEETSSPADVVEEIIQSILDQVQSKAAYLSKEAMAEEVATESTAETTSEEGQQVLFEDVAAAVLEEKVQPTILHKRVCETPAVILQEEIQSLVIDELSTEACKEEMTAADQAVEQSEAVSKVLTAFAVKEQIASVAYTEPEAIKLEEINEEANVQELLEEADASFTETKAVQTNAEQLKCPIAILKSLHDCCVLQNETATLVCELSQPNIEVEWQRNGARIVSSEKMTIKSDGNRYMLSVTSCGISDSDSYSLVVEENVKCACQLTVQVPPRFDSGVLLSDNLSVNAGCTARKTYSFIAFPTPMATLTFQAGENYDKSRISVQLKENNIIEFEMLEAITDDHGDFVISLENTTGKVSLALKVTVNSAPSPPSHLLLSDITKNSCSLTWEQNNESNVTGFFVELSVDCGSTWTRLTKSHITERSFILNDLTESCEYSVRVCSVNEVGQSPSEGVPFVAKDGFTIPSQPNPPSVESISECEATLRWSAPDSDGGSPITSYVVEWRKLDADEWSVGLSKDVGAGFMVRGLEPYNSYLFRVTAANAAGFSEPSLPSSSAQYAPPRFTKDAAEKVIRLIERSSSLIRLPFSAGDTEVTTAWTRDGVTLLDTATVKTMTHRDAVELIFTETQRTDAGVYGVTLNNNQGQCSYAITVQVQDKPGPVDRLRTTSVTETDVTLTWSPPADDGGSPITGYLVESRLLDSETWTVITTTGCLEVTADSLMSGHSYLFRVAAENQCGVGQYVELSEPVKPKPLGVKPWFVRKLPSRIEVIEGESFTLVCHTGKMGCKPWFVKKLPVKMETQRGIDLEAECVIGTVADQDLGIGSFKKSSQSRSRSCSQVRKGKPMAPADLRVTELTSESASIEWESPLDPGGAPISQYVLEKREEGKAQWEFLTNLPGYINECELENMLSDKGYYLRISAENQFGVGPPLELSHPIRVSSAQNEPPSRPANAKIIKRGDHTLELTWDLSASDPACPVLHYIIEKREMRGPRWVRVHKMAVPTPPYLAEDLTEGSEFEFQIYARNCVGISEPSGVLRVASSNEKSEDPARFIKELNDVLVEAGSKAEFECGIAGNPKPQVKWFKNLREIFDGYRHKITQDGDTCQLVFNSVGQDDCGEVECRAFNTAGFAVSRAQLMINIPPQLMCAPRLLNGLGFAQGQPMNVNVPVAGRPMPEVTWMKDGQVLEHNGRREISLEDGTATLKISSCDRRLDSGQYSLRIRNSIGTDQATFLVTITDRSGPPNGKPVSKQISSDSCQLDWNKPLDDGGAAVTSYVVERKDSPMEKKRTDEPTTAVQDDVKENAEKKKGVAVEMNWQRVGSTHFTHMVVYRLTEDIAYKFRVYAENAHGLSEPSEESETLILQKCSNDMNYDMLVCSEPVTSYKKVDVTKLKGETELDSKYIICEELGRGPYGVVHRAIERSTGKSLAAKFIACTTIERSMIRQEIELMSELRHHCLLHLHEAFETKGEIAFMLELISGNDLVQRIMQQSTSYSELDCIHWLREICQGIAHMHKNNIIHLDIRPENIMFLTSKSQDIKILNFGITQRVDPNRTVRVLFDTIEYCSPEVLTFAPVSFASDMWSLGVLAHILLSGISPFLGKTTDETYLNITEGKGVSFTSPVWNDVSHFAKNWIGRLVVKDAKKRMTVAEALAHPWLNGEVEAKLTRTSLPTENFKTFLGKQKWREQYSDLLPIGYLAHQGAVFLKLSQEGIAMERELFMELPDQAPEVVIELANTEAYEGTVGRFKCKFHSQPEATVKWFREEYALESDNPKYNIWYKHGLAMLNVLDVDLEDAGQYSCVATNRLGSCTTVGELNVQEQSFKRFGYHGGRRRSLSYERDTSLSDLPRSHSIERQTSLERTFGGGGSLCGSVNESHSSGYGSSSAKVAPQFVLPLMDQTQLIGSKCTHAVLMSCKPDIEVSWFRGQTKITPSNNYHVENNNNMFHLVIDCVTREDAGEWRCLGVNSYGQCMCVCKLDVLDEVPADSQSPKFTQTLSRTIVIEGGPTRLECKITGTPPPDVQWFKDRRPIVDDPFYMISCEETEVHSLYIPATYTEHAGWYTCQARNVAGTITTEAKLIVERVDCESMYSTHSSFDRASLTDDLESIQTKNSNPSAQLRKKKQLTSAPQFTARLRPKRCQEGQSVRFNCSVSGIPEPNITWNRANGTILHPSSRIHISNNYGLCSLEILRVRRDDEGLYIVRAENSEGEVSSSASLDVEEVLPSLMGRRSAPKSQSFDADWLMHATRESSLGKSDSCGLWSPPDLPSEEMNPAPGKDVKHSDSNVGLLGTTATDLQTTADPAQSSTPRIEKPIAVADITPTQTPVQERRQPGLFTNDVKWADDSDADTEVNTSDDEVIPQLSATATTEKRKKPPKVPSAEADTITSDNKPLALETSRNIVEVLNAVAFADSTEVQEEQKISSLTRPCGVGLGLPEDSSSLRNLQTQGVGPVLEEAPRDQYVSMLGSTVEFTCRLKAEPACVINWFKDGQPVSDRANIKCSSSADSSFHELRVCNVQLTDAGQYTITANDQYGSVSASATLTIVQDNSRTFDPISAPADAIKQDGEARSNERNQEPSASNSTTLPLASEPGGVGGSVLSVPHHIISDSSDSLNPADLTCIAIDEPVYGIYSGSQLRQFETYETSGFLTLINLTFGGIFPTTYLS